MMKLKYLAAGLVLAALSIAPASAQGVGQLAPGQAWANIGSLQGRGGPASITAILDKAFGSARGAILERGSSGWGLIGPGSTGMPFLSQGMGADPAYQVLGIAGGGTNCVTASGTCLDNITGFASTGVLNRTGAGTYSFLAAPAGTIVGTSDTQTLTNKTFNCANNACTVRLGSDVTGSLPLSNLAPGTSDTVLGYWGATSVSANAINNCSNSLTYSTSTHTFGCNTTAGTGTLTSLTPGGGLVSSITTGCSQTAITSSGTLSLGACPDARTTTTETINDGDRAKVLTFNNASAVAASILQAGAASSFQSGWFVFIRNIGVGTVTITPATSTINGQTSFQLIQGASGFLSSDGSNYQFSTGTSPASVQAQPAGPSGTTSTTGAMMGLGTSCKITPALTGRIKFQIKASISNSGSGAQSALAKYGTGTAPSNGASPSGTSVGSTRTVNVAVSGAGIEINIGGIVTGLTIGTPIWFDADIFGASGTTSFLSNSVDCNAFEF